MQDVYHLVAMAQGENVATTELSHQYSAAELNEITSVLQKMFVIQELILKVNQQYIESAAQADRYRTEPPFKLQGSYRNMNKMAEKISSVMNQDELMQLIEDHYQGESQLLTNGTEENLLKLAELRGNMSDDQAIRWAQIKDDFQRTKAMGGEDADGSVKIANQMIDLVDQIKKSERKQEKEDLSALLSALQKISESVGQPSDTLVEITNQPSDKIGDTLEILASSMENSIKPLILSMEKKMDIDLRTLENIQELGNRIDTIKVSAGKETRTRSKTTSKKRQKKIDAEKGNADSKRF